MGLQCLNLATLASCGFTQLDSVSLAPTSNGTAGSISTDGIPAANGNYYAFDANGNMLCFNPTTSSSCGSTNVSNGQIANTQSATRAASSPRASTSSKLTSPTSAAGWRGGVGTQILTCYNTATNSVCPGYPISEGNTTANNGDYLAPVLSASGTLLGICDVHLAKLLHAGRGALWHQSVRRLHRVR